MRPGVATHPPSRDTAVLIAAKITRLGTREGAEIQARSYWKVGVATALIAPAFGIFFWWLGHLAIFAASKSWP